MLFRSQAWLWHGYLASVHVTLLTSLWKAGKTTLLTGLLQRLGDGQPFLNRAVQPATALIVSEQATEHWHARQKIIPLGAHVQLLSRPFPHRPTEKEWESLIDFAYQKVVAEELDLFVVDPLASFLPSRAENNAGAMMDALHPLNRLTAAGAAVLLLHHPRKATSDPGQSARGSGALLGFADIVLELHQFGRLPSDSHRRRLIGQSRRQETPGTLAFQWSDQSGTFTVVEDLTEVRYRENWKTVLTLLKARIHAATPKDLLDDWPADVAPPGASTLNEWLKRAYAEKKIRRVGIGVKTNPFQYRLENEDDWYYDRGELPPIRPIRL